jgi:small neutral amino acid transporter SnatA (MarC family)
MLFDYAVSAFLTLFVVVDPVGLTPTFLAVTNGLPRSARRSVAVRASIIAGAILAGSALIGDWASRDAANLARSVPDCRRPVVIFDRIGNGVRRSHSPRR